MNLDPKHRALTADVEAARQRVARQVAKDPDHEVALAMYRADLRRAKRALEAYEDSTQQEEAAPVAARLAA
jgi:hypothetical protein